MTTSPPFPFVDQGEHDRALSFNDRQEEHGRAPFIDQEKHARAPPFQLVDQEEHDRALPFNGQQEHDIAPPFIDQMKHARAPRFQLDDQEERGRAPPFIDQQEEHGTWPLSNRQEDHATWPPFTYQEDHATSPPSIHQEDHGTSIYQEDHGTSIYQEEHAAPTPPIHQEDYGRESQESQHSHGVHHDPWERTALHEAHVFHGARRTPRHISPHHARPGSMGAIVTAESSLDRPRSAVAATSSSPRATLAPFHTAPLLRPTSTVSLGPDLRHRNTLSPLGVRGVSPSSSRPASYVENLNNVPYHEQVAPGAGQHNAILQHAVGNAASLLDTKKTLEMYRANVKKTTNIAVQYEFAIYMVNTARETPPEDDAEAATLIAEAKQILTRLADRAYPFAQYYLADGYFTGFFGKAQQHDYDKAFPLFVAASKHGHAEAGYRAALCYEFGWGTAIAYPKAVQFYRHAASKNHPGAATRLALACLRGHMGLTPPDKFYREGVKWLKRANESADTQYNAAPYELALLHLHGFGPDIFRDEPYAAQLLARSAALGHGSAALLLGRAYEQGLYDLPPDPALSVHFYSAAAARGLPDAMMALCAWYMVGAPPVFDKDETEAYARALEAAHTGASPFLSQTSRLTTLPHSLTLSLSCSLPRSLTPSPLSPPGFPKAEYAVAYFTEMGIGCCRDPLEANDWYVRAAGHGNEMAAQRLDLIRNTGSSGADVQASGGGSIRGDRDAGTGRKKLWGIF